MKGKGPHYPQYSYDILTKHSFMIYSDIIEYDIVGDTEIPLLRCIPFISKVRKGGIKSTGQCMIYQSLTNLHFEKLMKNFFHSIKTELRILQAKKFLLYSKDLHEFFSCFTSFG